MKKTFLSLFAILIVSSLAVVAQPPHLIMEGRSGSTAPVDNTLPPRTAEQLARHAKQLNTGPNKMLFISWDVLLPPPGSAAFESEAAKIATEILQNGYPTNKAYLLTNHLRAEYITQPQPLGDQTNPTVCRVIRIVSLSGNGLTANYLEFLTGGTDITGYFVRYMNFSDPNVVFSPRLIGITRPSGSQIFPHDGHTIHLSGRTLDTQVGEIIFVGVSFPYSTSPPNSVVAFLENFENFRLWASSDYVVAGVTVDYSIKSLDSNLEKTPAATNSLPNFKFSISATNPDVYEIVVKGDPGNSFSLNQYDDIAQTNANIIATGNNDVTWTGWKTNRYEFFRVRNQ